MNKYIPATFTNYAHGMRGVSLIGFAISLQAAVVPDRPHPCNTSPAQVGTAHRQEYDRQANGQMRLCRARLHGNIQNRSTREGKPQPYTSTFTVFVDCVSCACVEPPLSLSYSLLFAVRVLLSTAQSALVHNPNGVFSSTALFSNPAQLV
jgi:hypothetical protein